MLLALDTATPAVTVAVADGERVLAERTTVDARRHGELLAPAIVAVLAEAGVDRRDLTRDRGRCRPGPVHRAAGRAGHRAHAGRRTRRARPRRLHPRPPRAGRRARPARSGSSPTRAARRCTGRRTTATESARPRRVDGPYVERAGRRGLDRPGVGDGARLYPDVVPRTVATRSTRRPPPAPLGRARAADDRARPLYLRRPDVAEPAARKSVL